MLPQPTVRQHPPRPRARRRTRVARPRALRPRVKNLRLPLTHLQVQLPPTLLPARSRPRKPRRPTPPPQRPPLPLLPPQRRRPRRPLHPLPPQQVQWQHPRRLQLRPQNRHRLRALLPRLPHPARLPPRLRPKRPPRRPLQWPLFPTRTLRRPSRRAKSG